MSKTNMRDGSSVDLPLGCWGRIQALWPTKLWLIAVLNVWFWGCYLFLSRHALLPVHELPITWLDEWAGFRPQVWSWVYESNFLLAAIIPLLSTSRDELRRYAIGFVTLASASFLIFALFPVASPRPANPGEDPFLMFITRIDGPLNAFPSLHASCLVYVLCLARRLFGARMKSMVWLLLWVWAGLILFATLATKQHYAVDLLAGGLIGWGADWFAWDIASSKTRRRRGVASQAG